MTTINAPFREADVTRDVAGKFTGKHQTAPELTLAPGADADFDLATFMQEPPAVAEPYRLMQPVVYRAVTGEDVHATIIGFEGNGYARIVERSAGTIGDHEEGYRIVEERYLTEDMNVSRDLVERQQRGLAGATALAEKVATARTSALSGLDHYESALAARDRLGVDGRTDWSDSHEQSSHLIDSALQDLVSRDLVAPEVQSWLDLDVSEDDPEAFVKANDVVDSVSFTQTRIALTAQLIDQYTEFTNVDTSDVARVTDGFLDALNLGTRMGKASKATRPVEADIASIGAERREQVFPNVVEQLRPREKATYRKAVGAVSTAFDVLDACGLLGQDQSSFGSKWNGGDGEAAILTCATAQAAVLRHHKEETGITDAQLDAITTVFDKAIIAAQSTGSGVAA